ncbi:hypothetical protein GEMRC1_008925 [Eukaryota sp. GEM-RC1]
MTESSTPSTVSVESTVRRRLDLSAIPSSSDLSVIPRADSFVVSVGALFCLSSRKKNKIDRIESFDVYYSDIRALTPNNLRVLFLFIYNSAVQQLKLLVHPDAEPIFQFEYGRTYEYSKITAETISGWVRNWSTPNVEKRQQFAFDIRVARDNVSPADYTAFKKASEKKEVRSIDFKQLNELNPKLSAPDSAWNSWAEMFSKNSAIKANSVPADIAHLFRNVDLPIDDPTDGFEMGFLVEELARRIDDIDRKKKERH